MTGKWVSMMILLVLGMRVFAAQPSDIDRIRADFEKWATQLPYLEINSVLYDRPQHHFQVENAKKREENYRILSQVTDRKPPKEALLNLLSDRDGKIRTLAAVALFDREDPSVLPALVKLCGDVNDSFDGYGMTSGAFPRLTGIVPPLLKQTVGDFAKGMVHFYMERSGYHYGVKHRSQPGFAEYWNARKNRSHCAAWFAVQLARASRGTSPTQRDCLERIQAVRRRIDELPADEAAWILLWLHGEAGSDALATDQELVQAGKRLGADKLLLMLQNKIPSDDPDLQPRSSNNWPYKRMSLFVLRHADQLLRRDQSDALLACEQWQRDYQKHGITDPNLTAWWAVAAARLNPNHASRILRDAMQRYQGQYDSDERSTLCVALWQLAGGREIDYILDWFYADSPEPSSLNGRDSFIKAMGNEPNGREIICRLIDDRRLTELDWQSLERMVRVVNAWSETPIVTEEELRKAWHPLGQSHFHRSQKEAEQKYPKETADLRMHLDEWRKRLRMSTRKLLGVEAEKTCAASGPAQEYWMFLTEGVRAFGISQTQAPSPGAASIF